MSIHARPASGRPRALRANDSSTTVFKTSIKPYRIAVRSDREKSMRSKEKLPRYAAICTSLSADLSRISSLSAVPLRFSDDCQLKTDDPQRKSLCECELRKRQSLYESLNDHIVVDQAIVVSVFPVKCIKAGVITHCGKCLAPLPGSPCLAFSTSVT